MAGDKDNMRVVPDGESFGSFAAHAGYSDVDRLQLQNDEVSDGGETEAEKTAKHIWDSLADACGGYSQIPDFVVGVALAGTINNGALGVLSVEHNLDVLEALAKGIYDRWSDNQEYDKTPEQIKLDIVKGMRMQSAYWGENSQRATDKIEEMAKAISNQGYPSAAQLGRELGVQPFGDNVLGDE